MKKWYYDDIDFLKKREKLRFDATGHGENSILYVPSKNGTGG